MAKLTYLPQDGDFLETEVAGVKFTGGVAVELPPGKEWLAYHLARNPWFRAEIDPAAAPPEMPSTGPGDTSFGGAAPAPAPAPAAAPVADAAPADATKH